ncbi:MAG: farnesyl-diphosphate farnesyltransferase [Verrucomicrobiales bacterium]|jgi:farnesyl-diphosphate farnesyltransferase
MKLLPKGVRAPISLGYLLARASDTIADTRGPSSTVRKSLLVRYRGLIHVEKPSETEVELLANEIRQEILPKVHHDGEQALLGQIEACFGWLRKFSGPDRSALHKVLDLIVKAQINDVEVFGAANRLNLQFLQNEADLVRYADMVAGSVGIFWTEICAARDANFADMTVDAMRSRGERYGRGLQILNIVQDLGDDLKAGRCYLPHEQLLEGGWVEGTWMSNQASIMNVSKIWLDRAELEIRQGLAYAEQLNGKRLRVATILPALIAARTIRDIRKSQSSFLKNRIKVPRADVKKILWKATLCAWTGRGFEPLFEELIKRPSDNEVTRPGQHLS